MTSVSPSATIAIVLIARRIPRLFEKVRNVPFLLSTVKIDATMTIAMARPPRRRPTSRARPDQSPPVEGTTAGAAAGVVEPSCAISCSLLDDRRGRIRSEGSSTLPSDAMTSVRARR